MITLWLVNAEAEPRMFTSTRWSLVLAGANADGDTAKSAEALAELCRTYWRPFFLLRLPPRIFA